MANKQQPKQKKTGHDDSVVDELQPADNEQRPTQKNEPRRTPESRSDRESHIGGNNQSQSRRGAGGNS